MTMHEDRLNQDSERASLLQHLLETPIGRRWLFKAGLSSAAAVAVANVPVWSTPTGVLAQAAPGTGTGTGPSPSRGVSLQFALGTPTSSASGGGLSDLTLIANGARLPLVAHTTDSRAALKAQGGLWNVLDLQALTHYVTDAPLPSDRCMVVSVQGTRGTSQVLVSQHIYTPPANRRALAQLAASGGGLKHLVGSPQRLRALGLTAEQVSSAEHVVQLDDIVDTAQSPSVALVFHHPNVSTVDATAGPITTQLLGQTPEVQTLGTAINSMRQQGQDYATYVTATNDDGSPAQISINGVSSTFTTIQLNQTNTGFTSALKSGVTAGLKGVRNSGDLGQVIDQPLAAYPTGTPVKTWVQSQGVTPRTKPYTPPATAAGGGIQANLKVGYEPFQVPVSNGLVFGTGTQITSGYNNAQVQLRIYNNWVR